MSAITPEFLASATRIADSWGRARPEPIRSPFGSTAEPDCLRLQFEPGADVYLVGASYYPNLPPHVVVNWRDGNGGTTLSLDWHLSCHESVRLEAALRRFVEPPGPFHAVWGPALDVPATDNPNIAAKAGWR